MENQYELNARKFLVGYSLGGLLAHKIACIHPGRFEFIALLAPYFGFKHPSKFSKFDDKLADLSEGSP